MDNTVLKKILSENNQSVVDYKAGKDKALGFLVGQAMKQTKGKARLIARIEERHGIRTVEHAEELGIGTTDYELINIDSI